MPYYSKKRLRLFNSPDEELVLDHLELIHSEIADLNKMLRQMFEMLYRDPPRKGDK